MENLTQEEINRQIYEAAHSWCVALCNCAGVSDEEGTEFWNRLIRSQGIYSEYVYYMINQNFACNYKVNSISIVDIMVWQIDHFKAGLDMGRTERENPDRMLYTAFKTMLDMEDNPDELVATYYSDTGTDYPGKF